MTHYRQNPNDSTTVPWRLWGAIAVAVLWCLLFLQSPMWPSDVAPVDSELNGPRWLLLLVPDQTVASWFDGPVTLSGLAGRAQVLTVALALIAAASLAGWPVVTTFPPFPGATRFERVTVATACGLALQSLVTLLIGLAGGVGTLASGPLIVLLTLAAGFGVGWWGRRGRTSAGTEDDVQTEDHAQTVDSRWVEQIPMILFLALAALLVARAMMPPAEYDVREYHLQAPKEWSQTGRVSFMPHNIYANMPMAAEMHALLSMDLWRWLRDTEDAWWWGALSGKLVMGSYAILTACLLGQVVRRLSGRLAGLWTSVLVLSMPALFEGATLGLVEAALACFFAAGILVVVGNGLRANQARPLADAAWLGFWSGAAVACKYPALLFVAVPLALAAWCLSGDAAARSRAVRVACFLLCASIASGPWFLKNLVLAGNPVYPLAASVFGGETMTPEKIAQWNAAHEPGDYAPSALVDAAERLSWQWKNQSLMLIPLALIGAVATWRRSATRWLLAGLAVTLVMWWMLTHRIPRFLVPSLPLVFVLAGLGWASLRQQFGLRVATIAILVGIGMDAMMVAGPLLGDSRLAVDLSTLREDKPKGERPSRVPEHVRYVNDHLDSADQLLLVGDAAAFDYEPPVGYSTAFDQSPLARVLASEPPEDWSAALRDEGYTHVLVHWGEIDRLRSTYGFDATITRDRIAEMEAAGALQLQQGGLTGGRVALYRVGNE